MSSKQTRRRLRIIPWAIFLLGLLLTFFIQDAERKAGRRDLQEEFNFRCKEIVSNIERRMDRYEQVLEGAVGLFSASQSVERGEFSAYVAALKLEGKYPGIQGVGFAQVVRPEEKARHVAAIRGEGYPDYDIRPEGSRRFLTSIIYLEPFNWRNRRAFGYDMYSEPVRRAAMDLARDEGRSIISGKVRLVQETETGVQPGFLMYLPVYHLHLPHKTVAERQASLFGWVYAPFRMKDLMGGILEQHFHEISTSLRLSVYDGETPEQDRLMFDSGSPEEAPNALFHYAQPVSLFGRHWTVSVNSLPAFDARLRTDKADILAIAGTLTSGLLALVVWLLVTAQGRAVAIAEGMTEELRQSAGRQRNLNRALFLIRDCNRVLVHAQEEYRLMSDICHLCVERGGYLMAWVGYAEDNASRTVRPIAQSGYEDGYLDGINITWSDSERGRGPTGTAIRTGMTNVNQNVLTNPRMLPWREAAIQRGYQSSIALPLRNDARVLGALTLYAREADAFDPDEVSLLEEMANDLAYGIVALRTRAEHDAAKEQVAFLAHFDPLTHLPNRLLLRDRFEQATVAAQEDSSWVAMLYLDWDNFQQINDALGHAAGDRLLVMAVERLLHCISPTDTISRIGGDEFVVLLSGVADSESVIRGVEKIQEAFAESLSLDGTQLSASFSIGISMFPGDGSDFETLLKRADTAVNNAKEGGRNTYRFFTREMNVSVFEHMRLTGQLLNAVRNQEFVLHYQPQVHIGSGRIIGAEALVRWQHPQDGLISPAKFIPLAERSGYIIQIGEWVLHEACRQGKLWLDTYESHLVIAVNLSALQFSRGNILDMVAKALEMSGLPAKCLELELTESILLQDVEATQTTLLGLKALGVKLSIDDFGTGYSSLSYLKQLAVDKLKVDQSFIRDMLSDADCISIVKAIVQLGHALQLEVIAEGVETQEQLAFLADCGCDEVQGYLFSRPVPPPQLAKLLAEQRLFPA